MQAEVHLDKMQADAHLYKIHAEALRKASSLRRRRMTSASKLAPDVKMVGSYWKRICGVCVCVCMRVCMCAFVCVRV